MADNLYKGKSAYGSKFSKKKGESSSQKPKSNSITETIVPLTLGATNLNTLIA
jgi:hypothetical protein